MHFTQREQSVITSRGLESLPFIITTSLSTDKGCVRATNEDSGDIVQPSKADVLDTKGLLLVVADGMGGAQGGEVASRVAVETVAQTYYALDGEPEQILSESLREANRQIYKLALTHTELSGMGTTCTALVIRRGVAHSAHVGDSRLYLVRSRTIYQMTEDHSVVKEMIKQGSLTLEAARNHPDRNLILRALGSRASVAVAAWEHSLPIKSGDCFILCSDGLHNLVTDDEICELSQLNEAQESCESMVSLARNRGGYDNITVAIARVSG
jgi:PPM family protein phosphatase